mgnify:CR=1 FL=1
MGTTMDEQERNEITRLSFWGILALSAMLWCVLLASCSSVKYVPIEIVRTEYRTRDSIRYDSIYQRDSVYLMFKGDTVYKYKEKYLYKYLFLNKTDTVIKTDSIQVPYPVERKLTKWQAIKIELGGWAFGIIIAFALIIVGWLIYGRRKK